MVLLGQMFTNDSISISLLNTKRPSNYLNFEYTLVEFSKLRDANQDKNHRFGYADSQKVTKSAKSNERSPIKLMLPFRYSYLAII